MTAAEVMDGIARLPDCAGQAAKAEWDKSWVKVEDAPNFLSKFRSPNYIWIRLPRHKWPQSWSSIECLVVLLERNLYGRFDAGFLREIPVEKRSIGTTMGRNTEFGKFYHFKKQGLFLSIFVDDFKKMVGRKRNLTNSVKLTFWDTETGADDREDPQGNVEIPQAQFFHEVVNVPGVLRWQVLVIPNWRTPWSHSDPHWEDHRRHSCVATPSTSHPDGSEDDCFDRVAPVMQQQSTAIQKVTKTAEFQQVPSMTVSIARVKTSDSGRSATRDTESNESCWGFLLERATCVLRSSSSHANTPGGFEWVGPKDACGHACWAEANWLPRKQRESSRRGDDHGPIAHRQPDTGDDRTRSACRRVHGNPARSAQSSLSFGTGCCAVFCYWTNRSQQNRHEQADWGDA